MYYFYDGTKDMGFHGYKTEKAAIREAIIYAKRFPRRYIGVYEEHNFGGDFLGRVYIGTLKGKKTVKYETHSGTYRLNKDGSFGEYLSSNRYSVRTNIRAKSKTKSQSKQTTTKQKKPRSERIADHIGTFIGSL